MDNPEYLGGIPFPCGQCLACRINKRRVWTCRILLELNYHKKASFVTLTYSPENLPRDGSVSKIELQKFFKRMRKHGFEFKYYAVGEYGDRNWRPHYHIAFFGVGIDDLERVHEIWNMGRSHAGTLTADSAQYIAGYILKKMTNKKDLRLNGRKPEFTLSSRRPAIGLAAVSDLANSLASSPAFLKAMDLEQNVPIAIHCDGKRYPLGRYLRDKLINLFEFSDFNKPLKALRRRTFDDLHSNDCKDGFEYYLKILEKGSRTEKIINWRTTTQRRDFNV